MPFPGCEGSTADSASPVPWCCQPLPVSAGPPNGCAAQPSAFRELAPELPGWGPAWEAGNLPKNLSRAQFAGFEQQAVAYQSNSSHCPLVRGKYPCETGMALAERVVHEGKREILRMVSNFLLRPHGKWHMSLMAQPPLQCILFPPLLWKNI